MLTSDKQEYDVLLILYRTEWRCFIYHKCVHYITIYGILNFLVFPNCHKCSPQQYSFLEIWLLNFLAHLRWAIVTTERPSSVVRPLTFHILINSSEATGPIWTKLWWNGPWMAPFQICVRWSRLPTKMAAKLKRLFIAALV